MKISLYSIHVLQEVLSNYEILREQFPGAKLKASKFEDFVEAVQPIRSQLPVVTKEIGDTWIQGIASDPKKMAMYRSFSQALEECSTAGIHTCDSSPSN
jgi:hypothetical protein